MTMDAWYADYFVQHPVNRKYHHKLTFALCICIMKIMAMPPSHDEVVHGKASSFGKMPGDEWQKFGQPPRSLRIYVYPPGSQAAFMGDEFGQTGEWNFTRSLTGICCSILVHKGLQTLVKDLNHLYKARNFTVKISLIKNGFEMGGSRWSENSVYVYLRKGRRRDDVLTINRPLPVSQNIKIKNGERIGKQFSVRWRKYGGSGSRVSWMKNMKNRPSFRKSITVRLPPLAGMPWGSIKIKIQTAQN